MELIRGLHNLRPRHRGCVATVGAFDGVHLGHRAVIGHLLEKSRELGLPSAVMVFEPLPREYLSPLKAPARLMSFREKFVALRELGVDLLLRVRFNERVRTMSAGAFVEDIFVQGLGVRYVVLGDDFRFGNDREGDLAFMQAEGQAHGFEAAPTPTFALADQRVSSTRIREVLAAGEFSLAETLLGRPYSISGRVGYGRQLGRTLDAPTANVELNRLRAPINGVFAVTVNGGGLVNAPAVANVGTRPTVNDSIRANLEVHVLEGSPNLYGERIEVTFCHKMRDEVKYDSLDALKAGIAQDIRNTAQWFALRGH